LKKQSQFMPGQMGVTPFVKGGCDNNIRAGEDENKANRTVERNQFEAPASSESIGKRA
jgi:hypothetical protein